MVRCEPPNIETTNPPAIAAIIPAMGGASEAMANPNPNGKAISETTKPEKIFLGKPPKNCLKGVALYISPRVYD